MKGCLPATCSQKVFKELSRAPNISAEVKIEYNENCVDQQGSN